MNLLLAWSLLGIQSYEVWIMIIGALVCGGCGLIGCFLVLRRLSLLGDAISHSVLPGIVLAVMVSGSLSSPLIPLGALVLGLLTPWLIDVLQRVGRVQEDVSIGSVFTVFFAIGVIMVSNIGNIDVDTDCVLYGEIAMAPFDTWIVGADDEAAHAGHRHGPAMGGVDLGPRAVWILGAVLLLNLLFIGLCYKELKLSSFDPLLAAAMGLRPRLLHYLLMGAVAMTTVASFESVGAILVVAMLIAPGATAYLLTDRLSVMLVLSFAIGTACSILGYQMAMALGGEVSIAGCMTTVAGLLFAGAFVGSPRYGLLVKGWRQLKLRRRLLKEHLILELYREHEDRTRPLQTADFLSRRFPHAPRASGLLRRLRGRGLVAVGGPAGLHLTGPGAEEARHLLRRHRLMETWMHHELKLPADHLHGPADRSEHFLTPELEAELAERLEFPEEDPHGKPIPLDRPSSPPPPLEDP